MVGMTSIDMIIQEQHQRHSINLQGIVNNFLHLLEAHDTEQIFYFLIPNYSMYYMQLVTNDMLKHLFPIKLDFFPWIKIKTKIWCIILIIIIQYKLLKFIGTI